jgi:hypothetical protein
VFDTVAALGVSPKVRLVLAAVGTPRPTGLLFPTDRTFGGYQAASVLHGGRFDWGHYFENGARAVLERKGKPRSKEERRKYEERTRYLRVEDCIKSWSKKQPLAGFAYDYLCDLVHPNNGSKLVLLAERGHGAVFDVDGSKGLGYTIFDRIFPLVIKLCMDETNHLFLAFAILGADEEKLKTSSLTES